MLPVPRVDAIARLSAREISEILGTKPGEARNPSQFIGRTLLAGYLPAFQIGDVLEDGKKVASLPWERRSIRISNATSLKDLCVNDAIERPGGWTVNTPFRVLNKFEFQLGGIGDVQQSRCLIFRHNGVEYVLPKMVIFKTFYARHTRLINALCNGPWALTAQKVISFAQYESGIRTGIDPTTGDWLIVLQTGLPESLAHTLALLWFDSFGRGKADALFSQSLVQTMESRGGNGNRWFVNADIPHRFDRHPLDLGVQGFRLRAITPSRPNADPERFLITVISSSSWSLPNQQIRNEVHNSNVPGKDEREQGGERGYQGGKLPVTGDPNSIATSISDPDAGESTNMFESDTFEYTNLPLLKPQQKLSSVKLPPSGPRQSSGSSPLVSSGNPTYAIVSPAPAVISSELRAGCQQFEFLIRALDELAIAGVVQTFAAIAPSTEDGLAITRNGLPCWSLLKERDRKRGHVPKRKWESIDDESPSVASADTHGNPPTRTRHARSVLVLSIRLGEVDVALLEIEPRPSAHTFRMIAFVQSGPLIPLVVTPALDAIREYEGVFKDNELDAAFATMTSNPVTAMKHSYTYADINDAAANIVDFTTPVGLRAEHLGRALKAVAQPGDRPL